jgi:large subunit ribosomal protein L34
MHYPHKVSNKKRVRKIGFRARMKTTRGRKTINAKRRVGRKVQVV